MLYIASKAGSLPLPRKSRYVIYLCREWKKNKTEMDRRVIFMVIFQSGICGSFGCKLLLMKLIILFSVHRSTFRLLILVSKIQPRLKASIEVYLIGGQISHWVDSQLFSFSQFVFPFVNNSVHFHGNFPFLADLRVTSCIQFPNTAFLYIISFRIPNRRNDTFNKNPH